MTAPFTVDQHFAKSAPEVRAIYDRILAASRRLGTVHEDPKKTSIHLTRSTAFAGVATRKQALILTLKAASDIERPRVHKHEQASANRWHLEVKLERASDVDREVVGWLKAAYAMSE